MEEIHQREKEVNSKQQYFFAVEMDMVYRNRWYDLASKQITFGKYTKK